MANGSYKCTCSLILKKYTKQFAAGENLEFVMGMGKHFNPGHFEIDQHPTIKGVHTVQN